MQQERAKFIIKSKAGLRDTEPVITLHSAYTPLQPLPDASVLDSSEASYFHHQFHRKSYLY
jgi:hypothetical protein